MAYTEELIGRWVRRAGYEPSRRKRHRVESVINGELLTNCGKYLRTEGWVQTEIGFSVPTDICQVCS